MNILPSKKEEVNDIFGQLKPIDDQSFDEAIEYVLTHKDLDSDEVYNMLYNTKYNSRVSSVKEKEQKLFEKLSMRASQNPNLTLDKQNKEYQWVKINSKKYSSINHRIYLAPNPENMHEIINDFTEQALQSGLPIKFKYDLTENIDEKCDRIIMYTDTEANTNTTVSILSAIRAKKPHLFEGMERGKAWLYDTKVPGVYYTPEKPGTSYGQLVAQSLIEAKEIFLYMLGFKKSDNFSVNVNSATKFMKILFFSSLLKNGALITNSNLRLDYANSKQYRYNTETQELTASGWEENMLKEVVFSQNLANKSLIYDYFYNPYEIPYEVPGIKKQSLTKEQVNERINAILYGKRPTDGPTSEGR